MADNPEEYNITVGNYLIVQKMLHGGFIVSKHAEYRSPQLALFASTTMSETLAFIASNLDPQPASIKTTCAACGKIDCGCMICVQCKARIEDEMS